MLDIVPAEHASRVIPEPLRLGGDLSGKAEVVAVDMCY
jgi:hypothetical protein